MIFLEFVGKTRSDLYNALPHYYIIFLPFDIQAGKFYIEAQIEIISHWSGWLKSTIPKKIRAKKRHNQQINPVAQELGFVCIKLATALYQLFFLKLLACSF